MFCIGLTGGIGSGKSLVADMLQTLGAAVIDTDVIAHDLTGPGGAAMAAIRTAFGSAVIRPDGALDRAAMREQVFSDKQARQRLQDILHPMILREVETQAAQARGPYTVFVVPLLVESGRWRAQVARICVVDCEEDTQRARVRHRSGLTLSQIARIMQSQATRATRLAVADDIIDNRADTSLTALGAQVNTLHARWRTLAASTARIPSRPSPESPAYDSI